MAKKKKDIESPDNKKDSSDSLDKIINNIVKWDASKRVKSNTTLPSSYMKQRSLNKDILNYEFKVDEFAMRGLNKYRNILKSPKCECCDKPALMLIDSKDEMDQFCASILLENECCHSAIFLVEHTGTQRIIFTIPEYDEEENIEYIENIASVIVDGNDGFAEFDAEVGLHCYGLIIEKEKGQWMIQE